MSQHVIIGRFGSDDKVAIPTGTGEVATPLEFVKSNKRLEHGIGFALADLAKLNVFPTEVGVDLIVLAAHIHAADTRISRDTESQDSWTREIRLIVPVSNLALWRNTSSVLRRMLNFLTGDLWTIDFRERPAGFETIVKTKPPQLIGPPFDDLALFSGGLDSLIGAIDCIERGSTLLFVSHAGEGAISAWQDSLFEKLKNRYTGRSFDRLRMWMSFPDGFVNDVPSENTTRGRSFLFFATGAFAGSGLSKVSILRVPENGLIALNVPLDPLRLGALSTRTTHPFYIARWNDLLGLLGLSVRVENPYWDKTKGEMVAECRSLPLLTDLIRSTLSCASPTKARWKGHGTEHCGYCLPCLIRRAAIRSGLAGSDPTPYTLADLGAKTLDTKEAEGRQVRSFQFAIERLNRQPQLAALLIHKPGSLADETPAQQTALADVYRRGMGEVAALLAGVQTEPH
jgi:hypothetical protein